MANQSAEQITEVICQSIDTIVKQRISNLPYDQTIICTIVDDTNAEYGKYIVETNYNGLNTEDNRVKFTVFSENIDYSNGDRVYVRIPAGDFMQQKIITGMYVEDAISSYMPTSNNYYIAAQGEGSATLRNGGAITLYEIGEGDIFPGYAVCCIKFTPKYPPIDGTNYNANQLTITCNIDVEYTVPSIYNSQVFKQTYVVNLRSLNANLFRTTNKTLSYYINFESILNNAQPVQVKSIKLNKLQFAGSQKDAYQSKASKLSLENITYSFGYYIPNNIDRFLYLFVKDNFYDPDAVGSEKVVFIHYYDSSDYATKILRPIPLSEAFLLYYLDDISLDLSEASISEYNDYYQALIPISDDYLSKKKDQYRFLVSANSEDIIDVASSILLTNYKYYSDIYTGIIDGQKSGKFLVGNSLEEDNFNNGVFYIYGQDGKPTDASASHTTRKARIKLVNFVDTIDLNDEETSLTASINPNRSMILTNTDGNGNATVVKESDGKSAYINFKIAPYYSQDKTNNSIYWTYTVGEETYTYEQEILFGYSGSQGSDYSLILSLIRVQNSKEVEVPAVVIGDGATYKVKATLYNYNNEDISGGDNTVVFSKTDNTIWPTGFSINTNSGQLTGIPNSLSGVDISGVGCYSACATAKIESLKIEAYIPIPLTTSPSSGNYYILSGPSTITYDITGKKPFASKLPYMLKIDTSNTAITGITFSLVIPKASSAITDTIKSYYPKLDSNNLILPSAYNEMVNKYPPTIVAKDGNTVKWIQPLYIWQNKYPNSMRNEEATEVIIPEEGTNGQLKIINTNVGRVLSDGTGLFIGDYGTTDAATYGLYAFQKINNSDEVKKAFALTANGDFDFIGNGSGTFAGTITMMSDATTTLAVGSTSVPVYIGNGTPKVVKGVSRGLYVSGVSNTVSGTAKTATITNVVNAINTLKSAIAKLAEGTAVETQITNLLDDFDFTIN